MFTNIGECRTDMVYACNKILYLDMFVYGFITLFSTNYMHAKATPSAQHVPSCINNLSAMASTMWDWGVTDKISNCLSIYCSHIIWTLHSYKVLVRCKMQQNVAAACKQFPDLYLFLVDTDSWFHQLYYTGITITWEDGNFYNYLGFHIKPY